jgi:hypothetical protein
MIQSSKSDIRTHGHDVWRVLNNDWHQCEALSVCHVLQPWKQDVEAWLHSLLDVAKDDEETPCHSVLWCGWARAEPSTWPAPGDKGFGCLASQPFLRGLHKIRQWLPWAHGYILRNHISSLELQGPLGLDLVKSSSEMKETPFSASFFNQQRKAANVNGTLNTLYYIIFILTQGNYFNCPLVHCRKWAQRRSRVYSQCLWVSALFWNLPQGLPASSLLPAFQTWPD